MADLALTYDEPVATGWLRTELLGDHGRAALYLQTARGLLGTMRSIHGVNERVAAGESGGFYQRSQTLDDGTVIEVSTNNGMDMIRITALPNEGVEPVPEVKPKLKSNDQSMWIGVRMLSGGEHTRYFENPNRPDQDVPSLHLCVWEPSINGAEPAIISNRHQLMSIWAPTIDTSSYGGGNSSYGGAYPVGGVIDPANYPLQNLPRWPASLEASGTGHQSPYGYLGGFGVVYTPGGMMQNSGVSPHYLKLIMAANYYEAVNLPVYPGFRNYRGDASPAMEQLLSRKMFAPGVAGEMLTTENRHAPPPETLEEYDVAVFIDEKIATAAGINFNPQEGWYTVKVGVFGADTLNYTPMKLEVTIVVGSGESRKTQSVIVTISEFTRYFRGFLPKGFFHPTFNHPVQPGPPPFDYTTVTVGDYGPNPMGKHWWQGGVRIYLAPQQADVPEDQFIEHQIVVVNNGDKLVPPTGFDLTVEFPPRADRMSKLNPEGSGF